MEQEKVSMKEIFNTLRAIDMTKHEQTIPNTKMTYIAWSIIADYMLRYYPDFTYKVVKANGKDLLDDDKLYFGDDEIGYMVAVKVTVCGIERFGYLPIIDSANKTIKLKSYTYINSFGKEKIVDALTMFEVNSTIMRCMVKVVASQFGLGLSTYQKQPVEYFNILTAPKSKEYVIDDEAETEEFKAQLNELYNAANNGLTKLDNKDVNKFFNAKISKDIFLEKLKSLVSQYSLTKEDIDLLKTKVYYEYI